jgi:hypothetical protein
MTIYDSSNLHFSPWLIENIVRVYRHKLERKIGHNLSRLLCFLGILKFEHNPAISSICVHITGVNNDVYDSYNKNIFFQLVVCYYLDSIGLLYNKPRVFFDKSSYERKLVKSSSVKTSVKTPAGFIPNLKYEPRKKVPTLTRLCQIDKSLKIDSESLKTITVEEVNELKIQAFLKEDVRNYYLYSEKNCAIKAINERRDLNLEQKESRIECIENKYKRNLTKYMAHVASILEWSPDNLKNSESDIARKEKSFLDLSIQLVNLKVAEKMTNDEQQKLLATQRRIELEQKQNQEEKSLIEANVRLAKLKVYYQAISTEATAVEQQLATPESQDRYFAKIQVRKTHERLETSTNFLLSDFDKNNNCIHRLDELINDVESNLGQIQSVVSKNHRLNCMHASFNDSTRMVRLYLGDKAHDIELLDYLYHLKEGTRKSDIERIERYISEICSNLSGWIASLSGLNPRVEQDLSKILDTVKFYWRASFDVSTKKVCLIHPDEKFEHLDIPEYVGYLRSRIAHFQEILAEKKRMCQ